MLSQNDYAAAAAGTWWLAGKGGVEAPQSPQLLGLLALALNRYRMEARAGAVVVGVVVCVVVVVV